VDLLDVTLALTNQDQRLHLSGGTGQWQGSLHAGQTVNVDLQFAAQASRQDLVGAELLRVDLHMLRDGGKRWLGAASYTLPEQTGENTPNRVADQDQNTALNQFSGDSASPRYYIEYSLD
jgi:hypothetical protein